MKKFILLCGFVVLFQAAPVSALSNWNNDPISNLKKIESTIHQMDLNFQMAKLGADHSQLLAYSNQSYQTIVEMEYQTVGCPNVNESLLELKEKLDFHKQKTIDTNEMVIRLVESRSKLLLLKRQLESCINVEY